MGHDLDDEELEATRQMYYEGSKRVSLQRINNLYDQLDDIYGDLYDSQIAFSKVVNAENQSKLLINIKKFQEVFSLYKSCVKRIHFIK